MFDPLHDWDRFRHSFLAESTLIYANVRADQSVTFDIPNEVHLNFCCDTLCFIDVKEARHIAPTNKIEGGMLPVMLQGRNRKIEN